MRKLVLFATPFAVGTALCQYLLPPSWQAWTAAAALLLGLALSRLWKERRAALSIAAFGLAVGMLWFAGYAALFLAPAEELAGTEDTVTLEVLDYAEKTDYGARCTVRVLDRGLKGRAVCYGDQSLLDLEPGNRLTAAVKYYSAARMSGEESTYYTSKGVFLRLYSKGEPIAVEPGQAGSLRYLPQRLALRLRETISAIFAKPAAGFVTALLTGEREGLDAQSLSDLTEAGLMHLTAVSGLHCGFLIGLLGLLLARRQRLTALVGYPVLLGYMVMVGRTPSVVRSCVMVGFLLFAPLVDREGDPPTSLAGAALVILLANPFAVASVSFQLSFAAVAGLLAVTPKVYAALGGGKFRRRRVWGMLWNFAAGSLSASLGALALTAPLSAVYFGALSLVSPLSNLLVLWVMPVLFALAFLVTLLCVLWPGLAPLAAVPELLTRYVLWAAGAAAKLPGHAVYFTGPVMALWLVFVYLLLTVCWLSRERRRKYLFAAALAALALLAVRSLPALTTRGRALTVVAVDVGQGAATLLSSNGVTALVDCGSLYSPRGPGNTVADAMADYGWDRLDFVALTHYHADHAGGLGELLARVEVGELLLPQLLSSEDQGELQREVLELARRYGTAVTYIETLTEVQLGGAALSLYPPVAEGDTNEEGLAVLCTAGDFDVLITGDMGGSTEHLLVEQYDLPDIEVLLVGHHGSKYSTSEELLEAVTPEVGVISVGENTYGHPTAEVMERMTSRGMTLYRTDLQGNILIRVHGQGG